MVISFVWKLITGEIWRIWQEHEQKIKNQAVADSPSTREELLDVLGKGKF